jgi:hypothetical protein
VTIKQVETIGKAYIPYTGERGLYVSRVPDKMGVDRLVNLVHKFCLCAMDEQDINNLHCTILYSPKIIPQSEMHREDFHPVTLTCAAWVYSVEIWPGVNEEGYLVARLQSKALESINRLWHLRGGQSTMFPEYKPHITLKTPFEEYRGLTGRLKAVNSQLQVEPILIRLENETVEDIRPKINIESTSATQTK